jgi:hypothetical protein
MIKSKKVFFGKKRINLNVPEKEELRHEKEEEISACAKEKENNKKN